MITRKAEKEYMKSFQFSIRVYLKDTSITPFIMPKEGMYKCHWSERGICHFDNVENGYKELQNRLEEYFYMNKPTGEDVIEYYDRRSGTLVAIRSQADFYRALMNSSQTYSPFSLVLRVNAVIREEDHWFNGEIAFNRVWKVSKPKFGCIRSWLMNLEKEGSVCKDISETCSYSEKAFLFCQLNQVQEGSKKLTNQNGDKDLTNENEASSNLNQSNSPKKTLTSLKAAFEVVELLEEENVNQKMLHEKMMMDPVISLILFNEYIPLQQPKKQEEKKEEKEDDEEQLSKDMNGLFLGKLEEEPSEAVSSSGGLFIRSEVDTSGGLFIRSEESSASPQCTTDDWVIA